jgi:NaMN:DMB phosphoribosyltransferase
MPQDHWLPGFNFTVEEWDNYETLVICRMLAPAPAVFDVVIAAKPAGRFMIRSRTRVVQ